MADFVGDLGRVSSSVLRQLRRDPRFLVLASVVPATAAQFGRAIIMPNLKPPVTAVQQALAYRDSHQTELG